VFPSLARSRSRFEEFDALRQSLGNRFDIFRLRDSNRLVSEELGLFTVRRKTIRQRMGAKLREVKQQLRERMHDPVRQTGQWLKSIVQGYKRYYAVPGNIDSLSVFRNRLTGHWWHTLRRRSQKRRLSWTRMLALADRWLPRPRILHPYPADRFAATHPR